jgi:hypothetical protein
VVSLLSQIHHSRQGLLDLALVPKEGSWILFASSIPAPIACWRRLNRKHGVRLAFPLLPQSLASWNAFLTTGIFSITYPASYLLEFSLLQRYSLDLKTKTMWEPGMAHASNPIMEKAEAGRSQVQGQPELHNEIMCPSWGRLFWCWVPSPVIKNTLMTRNSTPFLRSRLGLPGIPARCGYSWGIPGTCSPLVFYPERSRLRGMGIARKKNYLQSKAGNFCSPLVQAFIRAIR